jgi:cardiolipin synthase (CMP-forming)
MSKANSHMNLPNLLTIARIVAIPVIVALTILPVETFRWIALALFALAAITDFFDGYLARTMKLVSPLGRMLDPIADKLLVGALLIALAWDGTFSALDLIPAIAIMLREIFVSGLREYLGNERVVVPVLKLAKYKTTLQLFSLGICLAEPLILGLQLASDLLLWAAAFITLWTGWAYWRGALQHMTNSSSKD